jgi:hypothetical protein
METKREAAKKFNYVDLFKNEKDITIENIWRIFAHHTFNGQEVSAVQYKETKKAFVVGFMESFRLMSDIATKFGEEKASDVLTQISREGNGLIDSFLDRDLV